MSAARAEPAAGRLVRGGAWTLGGNLGTRALGLVHSVVVARGLDPHQVGVFAIVNYVIGLAAALADLGLPTAAAKLVAERVAARRRELGGVIATLGAAMLGVAGAAGLAIFLAADPLAAAYGEPALGPLFRLAAFLLALSLLGSLMAGVLQGLQQIERLAVVGVLKGLVALALLLLLLPPFGLAGVVLASIGAELAVWLLVARPLGAALGAAGGRPTLSRTVVRHGVGVALPVFANGLLVWGIALLVRSYLAAARGWAEVGYFQLADALSRSLLLASSAVAVPLVPLVAEAAADEPPRVAALARVALRTTLLTALPAALGLSLAARALVVALYGETYTAAGPLTAVLAAAAFLQALGFVVWSVLVGAGRVWVGFAFQAGGHAALVLVMLALVPGHGLAGLGVALVAGAAVPLALGLAYVRRRLGQAGLRGPALLAAAGWLLAGGASWAGLDGPPAAVIAVLGVLLLEWRLLTPEEAAWIRRRLGRGR